MSFLGINTKKLGKALSSVAKVAYKPVAIAVAPTLAISRFSAENPSVIPVPGAAAAGKVAGGAVGMKVGTDVLTKLSTRGEAKVKADPVAAQGKSYLKDKKQYAGYKVGVGLAAQGGTLHEAGLVRSSLGRSQKKGYDLAMAAAAGEANKKGGTPKDQFKSMVKAGVKRPWWTRFVQWLRFEK